MTDPNDIFAQLGINNEARRVFQLSDTQLLAILEERCARNRIEKMLSTMREMYSLALQKAKGNQVPGLQLAINLLDLYAQNYAHAKKPVEGQVAALVRGETPPKNGPPPDRPSAINVSRAVRGVYTQMGKQFSTQDVVSAINHPDATRSRVYAALRGLTLTDKLKLVAPNTFVCIERAKRGTNGRAFETQVQG